MPGSALYAALPPELASYVRECVGLGRYANAGEVLSDALRQHRQQQREIATETHTAAKTPDSESPSQLPIAIAQAADSSAARYEAPVRAEDGQLARVDFSSRPVHDSTGGVVDLTAEGRDVAQGKQAVAWLADSEQRFRTLTDAMPQMIWVTDAQGNTIYCNARMIEFTGLPHGLQGTGLDRDRASERPARRH